MGKAVQDEYIITIDHLPAPELSPNARVHWIKKHNATQVAKDEICWLIKTSGGAGETISQARISYEFHFKNRHRRDFDNLFSACKAWQDGLVLAGVIAGDDFEHLEIGYIKALVTGHEETIIIVEELPSINPQSKTKEVEDTKQPLAARRGRR